MHCWPGRKRNLDLQCTNSRGEPGMSEAGSITRDGIRIFNGAFTGAMRRVFPGSCTSHCSSRGSPDASTGTYSITRFSPFPNTRRRSNATRRLQRSRCTLPGDAVGAPQCGLRERGHEIELLAARDSPLANRASESEITVHQVQRLGLRGWAARAVRGLIARRRFELVHLNEPHALTAAWLARAHRRVPLLLSRRIGFPLQRNAVSLARYGAVERFIANSKNVAQSLIDSDIAAERISIVNEGVEIFPLRTPEQRSSARKHWGVREGEFLFGCVSVLD